VAAVEVALQRFMFQPQLSTTHAALLVKKMPVRNSSALNHVLCLVLSW
jgi:hypothetical protein